LAFLLSPLLLALHVLLLVCPAAATTRPLVWHPGFPMAAPLLLLLLLLPLRVCHLHPAAAEAAQPLLLLSHHVAVTAPMPPQLLPGTR
jgi:hypothetical protein